MQNLSSQRPPNPETPQRPDKQLSLCAPLLFQRDAEILSRLNPQHLSP
ncbi:hypothetical protein [Kamptonema formosum]|nr:hypothetical protein [Oscillatoria sp. PCC 10802]